MQTVQGVELAANSSAQGRDIKGIAQHKGASGRWTVGACKMMVPPLVLAWALLPIDSPTNGFVVQARAAKAAAKAAPRQLIYSLSQEQQNSDSLKVWGVPACVLIGKERPRGLYITGFTGDGLGNQLGLEVGDVLLSLNGHVLLGAKQADSIMANTKSGQLSAVIAHPSAAPGGISLKTQRINITSDTKDAISRAFAAESAANSSSPAGSQSHAGFTELSADELESFMFSLVNQDRQANGGIHPVSRSSTLSTLARKYADDMKTRNFFDHKDPDGLWPVDRARRDGITVSVWENLAVQFGSRNYKKLVYQCQQQMMNEPPNVETNHRGNILREKHHSVGIGVAIGQGKVLCVQEFSPADLP
jgi:uncharacterized protein YkwD